MIDIQEDASGRSRDGTLTPNATYVAQGYTQLSHGVVRLTASAIPCPL